VKIADCYLGPYQIELRVKHDLKDDEGDRCDGLTCFDDEIIWLDSDLPDEVEVLETLIHEALHMVSNKFRIQLTEEQITILGIMIAQMYRDTLRVSPKVRRALKQVYKANTKPPQEK
jgi:hypothetical protein